MGISEVLFQAGTASHAALYKLLGGRMMGAKDEPGGIVVVTTTGRKSGKQRSRPLMHLRDGEKIMVVASAGGDDNHPSWFLNMQAKPEVTVHVGGEEATYRARTVEGRERDDLYKRFVAVNDTFADYENKTDRVIPVVVLEPVS